MNIRWRVALAVALMLMARSGAAQNTFTVTCPLSLPFTSFDIDGQANPTLTVVRGQAYTFTLVNCGFHPFNIQTVSGWPVQSQNLYAGVTNNGGSSGTVTLTVPRNEPANNLYYQCGNHAAMNGTINIVDPAVSSPTFTPTPTPTPTAGLCVGDCDQDGQVTVDDILTMVNIALGNALLSECEAGDADQDGKISVDELLSAVIRALNGCLDPVTPTPTASRTLTATSTPTPPPTFTLAPAESTWTPSPPPLPTPTPTLFVPPYY